MRKSIFIPRPGLWSRNRSREEFLTIRDGENLSTPTPGYLSFCFQQKIFSRLILEIGKMLFRGMETQVYEMGFQANE